MPRLARVVMPNYPHHIIQRGNRRQRVFFSDKDKYVYLKILKQQSKKYKLEFWAYCLMDNHVHFIAIPKNNESFRAIAETNRRYTHIINQREGWRGYLWQGRFISFVLDEAYCWHVMKYIENNPVRANMVENAGKYKFSSARFHIYGSSDDLLVRCFLQDKIKDWGIYLNGHEEGYEQIRKHEKTGRPLGSKEFIQKLEQFLGRVLVKQKPGPKT